MNPYDASRTASRLALAETVCRHLRQKGFSASLAASEEEARSLVLSLVPPGSSVGIPGSVTVRELDLPRLLEERGCRMIHHWDPDLRPEDRSARLAEELAAEVFLTSTNALTRDGKLVNIDGTGNRVAGLSWAPGRLVVVAGTHKICPDLESALRRARDAASPPNARRLGLDVPCATLGHCVDCDSPRRICRAVSILERAPLGRDAHVVLVDAPLGY